MSNKVPVLDSARLVYKPITMQHLTDVYVSWMNDTEVCRFLESGGNYTIQKLEEYIKSTEGKNLLFWGIHLKESDKHIGNIKIDPLNARHSLGEYGILMGDRNEWGKGYAKEASQTIIDYCFGVLNLRKMTLGVVKDNDVAVQLYYKLGFQLEGTYIKHGFYNNKYCDVLRMALFNPDYKYPNA